MITCRVCPHHCPLTETTKGICGARIEKDGASYPLNYGKATALHLDPIEKKPLAHFHPGSRILSYGSYGCNMRCTFCQNFEISNGYTSPETLETLLEVVDAFNFDLKAFTEEFYRKMGGGLEPVKASIAAASKRAHVEVTTLVIPGENDSPAEMEALCSWLASVSPDIPLHLSRFFPAYKMLDKSPTPIPTLRALETIAKRYLKYVHVGNI